MFIIIINANDTGLYKLCMDCNLTQACNFGNLIRLIFGSDIFGTKLVIRNKLIYSYHNKHNNAACKKARNKIKEENY